jgi:NAD(P)H dehydrogenase (quinone)
MKVAVSAASGGLGTKTLKYLVENVGAENVVAVARSPERVGVEGIEKRSGDYLSTAELTEAFTNIDSLVMISAPVGDWDRNLMHRNVIEAAKNAGVKKLVYTSVVGNGQEEDTWFWPTQQDNRQTEVDVEESGLDWIIARNGLYLEKDVENMVRSKDVGVYRNIAGDGKCGYITVDELAYATAKLAIDDRANGQVFNLCGECLTQAQLVELANDVFGMDLSYETISDEESIAVLMKHPGIAARGEHVAKMLTGCFQALRAGAFDMPSDFERAAGRPVKSTLQMMRELRETIVA